VARALTTPGGHVRQQETKAWWSYDLAANVVRSLAVAARFAPRAACAIPVADRGDAQLARVQRAEGDLQPLTLRPDAAVGARCALS